MLSRRENRKWPFEGIGLMLRFLATGGPLQLEGRRAWGSDRKPRNSATGSTAAICEGDKASARRKAQGSPNPDPPIRAHQDARHCGQLRTLRVQNPTRER